MLVEKQNDTLWLCISFFWTLAYFSNCLARSSSHSAPLPSWCAPVQFQMAHLVPLKPYAAPVPRSQSLCDQPTKNMSAFPTQDPSLNPTPRPVHSRELVRQNSDPTSETPGPQGLQMREDRGPWIRLPDVELPPKVNIHCLVLKKSHMHKSATTFINKRFSKQILAFVSSDSPEDCIYCHSS